MTSCKFVQLKVKITAILSMDADRKAFEEYLGFFGEAQENSKGIMGRPVRMALNDLHKSRSLFREWSQCRKKIFTFGYIDTAHTLRQAS